MTRRLLLVLGLLAISLPLAAKKKDKPLLPDAVLKVQTVFVTIQPNVGEQASDPEANRKAQREVEQALLRWGRFRLALDAETADLIITVQRGSGSMVTPTVNGGPVDSRPVIYDKTDSQIRIGGQQGHPPDQTGTQDSSASNDRAHPGMQVGPAEDTIRIFVAGVMKYPLDAAPIWTYSAKNALQPPSLPGVEEFHKAYDEADKAAQAKKKSPPANAPAPPSQPNQP